VEAARAQSKVGFLERAKKKMVVPKTKKEISHKSYSAMTEGKRITSPFLSQALYSNLDFVKCPRHRRGQ
jgi:hypothetical protein